MTIEVWVKVDAEGNYGVGCDQDGAIEDYQQAGSDATPTRFIKIELEVPPPTPAELKVVVPAAPATLTAEVDIKVEG